MMKQVFNKIMFSAMLIVVINCQSKKNTNCKDISFKRVYVERMGSGESRSYAHYLMVNGYNDGCFGVINFSSIAKKYVDTCSLESPIEIISFLYSTENIDFASHEPDLAEAKKYELISFWMDSKQIKRIYFNRNGVSKGFDVDDCAINETF
jgi:hypothetical protein